MKIFGLNIDKNRYRETVPQSLESFIKKQIAAGNDPKTTYFSKCDIIHGYSPTVYANHINNNPDMADYSHMQATDWVKCNIDGNAISNDDSNAIKDYNHTLKNLLNLMIGFIICSVLIMIMPTMFSSPDNLLNEFLSNIPILLLFNIPIILLIISFKHKINSNKNNNHHSNQYDLTKAVGVHASDLLENTGFTRLLIDYDEVKSTSDGHNDYIDKHEINMIIFQPSHDGIRRQYRMLAATTDEEYAIRNLTSNIYIVLETEGDKARLLVPDASMQAMFAASSIRTPSSMFNNMMQSMAAKGKIGLMVEDPRIYDDTMTNNIWLCDTFNDYNHDGIPDDKQMLELDNKNNKMPDVPSNAYTTI